MNNPIAFPGLGLGSWDPNPVAFTLLTREIRWYGIIMAAGFLLAALYAARRCDKLGVKADDLMDMLLWATPSAIIFARLYYVVFNFGEFRDDPMSVFYVWNGGIAMYGSMIGAILAAVIFCRVKKINTLAVMDIGALGLLIGQCIGRWGNFINREAYGYITDLPWGMEISYLGERYLVHPTFLYESLWNLIGFIALHFLLTRRQWDGQIFVLYIGWYGLGRFWIEGLRADSLYLFGSGIRVSQALALLSFATAIGILLGKEYKRKRLRNDTAGRQKDGGEDQGEHTEPAEEQ